MPSLWIHLPVKARPLTLSLPTHLERTHSVVKVTAVEGVGTTPSINLLLLLQLHQPRTSQYRNHCPRYVHTCLMILALQLFFKLYKYCKILKVLINSVIELIVIIILVLLYCLILFLCKFKFFFILLSCLYPWVSVFINTLYHPPLLPCSPVHIPQTPRDCAGPRGRVRGRMPSGGRGSWRNRRPLTRPSENQ